MKRTIQYFAVGIVVLLICAISFFIGRRVENERTLANVSMLHIGPAMSDNVILLELLEKKRLDEAKRRLESSLDTQVLELYAYQNATGADPVLKKRNFNRLVKIAERRKKNPVDVSPPEINLRVNEILESVLRVRQEGPD